jgi:hypothetical protein
MKEYHYKGEDKIVSIKEKRQCSLCEMYHTVGEEKDVYECYSVYRSNNPRKEIEGSVEIWNIEKKVWVKKYR